MLPSLPEYIPWSSRIPPLPATIIMSDNYAPPRPLPFGQIISDSEEDLEAVEPEDILIIDSGEESVIVEELNLNGFGLSTSQRTQSPTCSSCWDKPTKTSSTCLSSLDNASEDNV